MRVGDPEGVHIVETCKIGMVMPVQRPAADYSGDVSQGLITGLFANITIKAPVTLTLRPCFIRVVVHKFDALRWSLLKAALLRGSYNLGGWTLDTISTRSFEALRESIKRNVRPFRGSLCGQISFRKMATAGHLMSWLDAKSSTWHNRFDNPSHPLSVIETCVVNLCHS